MDILVRLKAKFQLRLNGIPVFTTFSTAQNFIAAENKTSLQMGAGTPTQQAFGKLKVVKSNNSTTLMLVLGLNQQQVQLN